MNYYFYVLRNYANFQGRASRKEYWYFVLFNFIFALIIDIIALSIKMPMIYPVYILAILIPSIAVGVRRMHDVNKSGWYIIIPIYSLVLCCTAGTNGENEYGDDPYREPAFEFEAETPNA
jgi:uncharacterized membrane protein YhaH (DUF805 family)